MAIKLQIFTIKSFVRLSLIMLVWHLDSTLKENNNYYPRVFSKECKYIEKNVIRHINDNLSGFSSPDNSDEE